jgi:hypothetical protein
MLRVHSPFNVTRVGMYKHIRFVLCSVLVLILIAEPSAWWKRLVWLPIVLLIGSTVFSQDMSIPVDVQVQLMAQIFSFDRAMDARTKEGMTIGVLYQERYRTSASTADEVEDLLGREAGFLHGPFEVVRIPWENRADAERELRDKHVRILYVAPLRSVDVRTIGEMCGSLRISTFTGVSSYVNEGLALGVARRGGKATILINLPAARQAGNDFSSQLLHIAEVIEE